MGHVDVVWAPGVQLPTLRTRDGKGRDPLLLECSLLHWSGLKGRVKGPPFVALFIGTVSGCYLLPCYIIPSVYVDDLMIVCLRLFFSVTLIYSFIDN